VGELHSQVRCGRIACDAAFLSLFIIFHFSFAIVHLSFRALSVVQAQMTDEKL
jgi:hypothetical protein